jgi:RNA polymerase sigma-B factor
MATPVTQLRPAEPGVTGSGDLSTSDDKQLLTLVHSLPRDSGVRDKACEVLVIRYQSLVRSCVQPFRNSPESQEELMQVGYVGLLKAINNFDPDLGNGLAAYAQPCVSGEIKRHFRDKRWQVHVKRSLQELRLELRNAASELAHSLGHMPTDPELAQHLGISDEDVSEARRADLAFSASSLDAPVGNDDDAATVGDLLGTDDARLEHVLDMESVWAHWHDLPDRLQQILLMRFYGNMTQAEIGSKLDISQMHVSRLLADALRYLRERLSDQAQAIS